jgi:hypothetical protein
LGVISLLLLGATNEKVFNEAAKDCASPAGGGTGEVGGSKDSFEVVVVAGETTVRVLLSPTPFRWPPLLLLSVIVLVLVPPTTGSGSCC